MLGGGVKVCSGVDGLITGKSVGNLGVGSSPGPAQATARAMTPVDSAPKIDLMLKM